jgi:predicted nucleic acid-binding Zn ribbon protein
MHAFQREIQKREMLSPVFSYPYKVIPISEQAKVAFSLFNKRNGLLEKTHAELIKKYLNVEKFPFIGNMTFYYEDSNETEEQHKAATKELAIKNMADRWVPGVHHPDVKKNTNYVDLHEGTDFEIEIGEKVVYEQPDVLTFEDIKALK